MRKFLSKLFLILAVPFLKLSNYFSPHKRNKNNLQVQRAAKWFEVDGDKTLRLDYRLNANSIVFDVGGYEGKWASDIYCLYSCKLFIFEPVHYYFQNIKKKFGTNSNVAIYPFGLGGKNEKLRIGVLADASSTFKSKATQSLVIEIRDISEFIIENNIEEIQLIKINIEGGEYDLLESLISNNLIKQIKNLQIQFHDFVPDAVKRMNRIQTELSKTHRPTYRYEFVWENWERIK